MMALGVLLMSGLRRGRLAALALTAAVVALAATGLSTGLVAALSATTVIDHDFATNDGPHLVAYVDEARAAEAVAELTADPAIGEVATPVPVVEATLPGVSSNGGEPTPLRVRALADRLDGPDRSAAPILRRGRLPEAPNELVLDAAVARAAGIGLGAEVSLAAPSVRPTAFTVVATAYDYTDCFVPDCEPGRSWVTAAGFQRLTTRETAGPDPTTTDRAVMVAARARPPASEAMIEAAGRRLSDRLGGGLRGVDTWPDTRGDLLAPSRIFGALVGGFGILLAVGAGVVLAGAISARSAFRRATIALYRSVGVTAGQLTAALVVEHLILAMLGGVTGWLVAGLLAPRLRLGPLAVVDRDAPMLATADLMLTVGVMVVIVGVATVLPAWSAGHQPVARALHDRIRAAGPLSRWVERALAPLEGRPVIGGGVRQAVARPGRALAVAAGLALALVAGIVSLSLDHSIERLAHHPALLGDPYDAELTLPPGNSLPQPAAAAEAQLDGLAEVASWFTIADTRAAADGVTFHVRVVGGRPDSAHYLVGEGRGLAGTGEALVGYELARRHGWTVGQQVVVSVEGVEISLTIVGRYLETEDQGNLMIVGQATLAEGPGAWRYAVTAAPGVRRDALVQALRSAFGPEAVVETNQLDETALRPFRVALGLLSGLAVAVAVSQLIAATAIATGERAPDLRILRALGVRRFAVVASGAISGLATAAVAASAGIPLAHLALAGIATFLARSAGTGPGLVVGAPAADWLVIMLSASMLAAGVAALTVAATDRQGHRGASGLPR